MAFVENTHSINQKLTSVGINTTQRKPTNTMMRFGGKNKRLK